MEAVFDEASNTHIHAWKPRCQNDLNKLSPPFTTNNFFSSEEPASSTGTCTTCLGAWSRQTRLTDQPPGSDQCLDVCLTLLGALTSRALKLAVRDMLQVECCRGGDQIWSGRKEALNMKVDFTDQNNEDQYHRQAGISVNLSKSQNIQQVLSV